MAKSLRSKWRRKCRAVKRVRYGQKELERLKKMLGVDEKDTKMEDLTEIACIVDASAVQHKEESAEDLQQITDSMEIDEIKKKFNVKTLRDKNGAYPVWLHPRKIIRKKKSKGKKPRKGKNQH